MTLIVAAPEDRARRSAGVDHHYCRADALLGRRVDQVDLAVDLGPDARARS